MVNSKCCIPSCKSGYKRTYEKASFFAVTKARIEKWGKLIERKDRALSANDVICSKHFDPKDILTHWCAPGSDIKIPYKIPRLRSTATPCFFDNDIMPKQANIVDANISNAQIPQEKSIRTYPAKKIHKTNFIAELEKPNVENKTIEPFLNDVNASFDIKCEEITIEPTSLDDKSKVEIKQEVVELDSSMFLNIYNDVITLNLPLHWSKICVPESSVSDRLLVFCNFVFSSHCNVPVQCKKVSVDENFNLKLYYGDKLMTEIEGLKIKSELESSIDSFAKCTICKRGPGITVFGKTVPPSAKIDVITSTWRHVDCSILVKDGEYCKLCTNLWESMRVLSYRKH